MKSHLPDIFQTRINPNYILMSRLSMDLKVMPKSQKGHKYVLCVIDESDKLLDYGTNIPGQIQKKWEKHFWSML